MSKASETFMEKMTGTPARRLAFAKGYAALCASEVVLAAMEQVNMDRDAIAEATKRTRGGIDALLDGDRTWKLADVVVLLTACGMELEMSFKPFEAKRV